MTMVSTVPWHFTLAVDIQNIEFSIFGVNAGTTEKLISDGIYLYVINTCVFKSQLKSIPRRRSERFRRLA